MTIFFGMNDVLATTESCSSSELKRDEVVSQFKSHMTSLMEALAENKNGHFDKLYVNLMTLFRVSYMGLQNSGDLICKLTEKRERLEFPCMRSGGDMKVNGRLIDEVTGKMNQVLHALAANYNLKRPDMAVNLVRSFENQQINHEDLRSHLDCFHPTAKAQRIMGTSLWNAMLNASEPTPVDDLPRMAICADANTKLVTFKHSEFVGDPVMFV